MVNGLKCVSVFEVLFSAGDGTFGSRCYMSRCYKLADILKNVLIKISMIADGYL